MEPMTLGLIALGLVGAVGGVWLIGLLTGSSPSWITGLLGGGTGAGVLGFGSIFTDTYAVFSASIGGKLGLAGWLLIIGTLAFVAVLAINAFTDWRRDRPIRLVR
jgi:hypothetical protein